LSSNYRSFLVEAFEAMVPRALGVSFLALVAWISTVQVKAEWEVWYEKGIDKVQTARFADEEKARQFFDDFKYSRLLISPGCVEVDSEGLNPLTLWHIRYAQAQDVRKRNDCRSPIWNPRPQPQEPVKERNYEVSSTQGSSWGRTIGILGMIIVIAGVIFLYTQNKPAQKRAPRGVKLQAGPLDEEQGSSTEKGSLLASDAPAE
jgi:hypothetical protein